MKWRCALLQRWLPDYLDGNLPAFWQRRIGAHLSVCPGCRQELEALHEVVAVLKAQPMTDPGPGFWEEFSREMHLKLVQAAQTVQPAPAPPAPRRSPIPYLLLGAPALAALILAVLLHFTAPSRPLLVQPQMAHQAPPAPKASQVVQAPAPEEQYAYAALGEEEDVSPEEDVTTWDVEPLVSRLTDQERKALLNRLRLREKDGSCATLSSSVYVA